MTQTIVINTSKKYNYFQKYVNPHQYLQLILGESVKSEFFMANNKLYATKYITKDEFYLYVLEDYNHNYSAGFNLRRVYGEDVKSVIKTITKENKNCNFDYNQFTHSKNYTLIHFQNKLYMYNITDSAICLLNPIYISKYNILLDYHSTEFFKIKEDKIKAFMEAISVAEDKASPYPIKIGMDQDSNLVVQYEVKETITF